jgi:hypothetical protein
MQHLHINIILSYNTLTQLFCFSLRINNYEKHYFFNLQNTFLFYYNYILCVCITNTFYLF